jgi:tetratricopeptide (TPR) repeat protein
VLTVLVERNGHLVERSELVNAVWGDTFIEEGNLTVTISMLRKALGDDRGKNKLIETIAKRGYRFLPEVHRRSVEPSTYPDTAEMEPGDHGPLPLGSPVAAGHSRAVHLGGVALLLLLPVTIGVAWRHGRTGHPVAKSPPRLERFVAVAPFNVAGTGATDPHIGATVAADLVGRFGRKAGLKARSVSELPRYSRNGGEASPEEQTEEVDALLTGLIDVKPGETRVTARLSNAKGETLWSGSYAGAPEQMQQLEDQIESTVHERMLDLMPVAHPEQPSHDPQAQRLYLAGRYFWNERTELGLRRGIECFQQAIFRDPNFAEAYAGLADSYALLASYSVEPPSEAYPSAKAAAQRALQLNANLAEGHTALGMVALYYEWDWKGAQKEFKKAIDLSPEYAGGYAWNSLYFAAVGDTSQALQQALKAQEMDPMSMAAIMHLGSAYYWDRQFDKAEGTYRFALAQNSNFSRAHSRLGIVLAAEKDYAGAIHEFRETERLSGSDPYTDGLIGYAEAMRGNVAAARKILDELTRRSAHEYVPAFSLAQLYLGLGNRDMALEWLERARKDRSTYLVYAKVDPLLDPLRSDRRFDLLLSNMELPARKLDRDHPTDDTANPEIARISLVN